MYKQEGGEYVAGLPAEAGEYTILACALDSVTKTYYETEFVISIKVFATLTFDGQTNNYGSIVEAVNAAKALGTTDENRAVIKLLDNVDLPSTLLINTGFVTLDLNGYIIKMTGSGSVIQINGGADVILTDGSSDVTHNYYVAEDGLWTFYDGDLPEAAPDGAVTGVVTGGVLTGGNALYYGGGVYVRGTFTMNGGVISGNTAGVHGGGVYVVDGGTFTMTGGTISGNTTVNYSGGGVSVYGTFTMTDGTISDNTAKTFGGGVDVEFGTFTMTGGTISDNMATSFGSCVYKNGGTGYGFDFRRLS